MTMLDVAAGAGVLLSGWLLSRIGRPPSVRAGELHLAATDLDISGSSDHARERPHDHREARSGAAELRIVRRPAECEIDGHLATWTGPSFACPRCGLRGPALLVGLAGKP